MSARTCARWRISSAAGASSSCVACSSRAGLTAGTERSVTEVLEDRNGRFNCVLSGRTAWHTRPPIRTSKTMVAKHLKTRPKRETLLAPFRGRRLLLLATNLGKLRPRVDSGDELRTRRLVAQIARPIGLQ